MDKLTKIKLKWLNDNFNLDKMKMYKHDYYPNSIFYKKGDIFVINQDLKNKKFWIDYNQIWSFFESFFGMEYTEIQSIMNIWLEETDKLREYTPQICHSHLNFVLEETDKLREYTPLGLFYPTPYLLEDTDKLREYTPKQ